jgi:hypothetical protein
MERNRRYPRTNPRQQSPESRKKSARKSRLTSYGLTLEQFDLLLTAQGHSCGMCHKPFSAGQRIAVDHDHACCDEKLRSCGQCVRGLLCLTCNITLGHIERRYASARAYLDQSAAIVQLIRPPRSKIPAVERFLEDLLRAGLPGQALPQRHDQLHVELRMRHDDDRGFAPAYLL